MAKYVYDFGTAYNCFAFNLWTRENMNSVEQHRTVFLSDVS